MCIRDSVCAAMMSGGYGFYMWTRTDGAWTQLTSFILTFAIICALYNYKREHPTNLILLGLFTLCMSYSIGITTTAYAAMGLSALVVEAFAITAIVFIGLTVFAMWSKIDFSLCASEQHSRPPDYLASSLHSGRAPFLSPNLFLP